MHQVSTLLAATKFSLPAPAHAMLSLFFMTETMLGMQWYRNMQSRNSYQQWVFSRPYWPLWTTPLQKYEFILPILEINWLCVIIGYWNGSLCVLYSEWGFFPCLPFELFSSLSYFILVHDPFKPNTSTWKKQVPAPFSHMRIFSCNSTIYIIDNLRILIPFSKLLCHQHEILMVDLPFCSVVLHVPLCQTYAYSITVLVTVTLINMEVKKCEGLAYSHSSRSFRLLKVSWIFTSVWWHCQVLQGTNLEFR